MSSPLGGLLLMLLSATPAAAAPDGTSSTPYKIFAGEVLVQGRAVWLANCETCHGYGIAGAPIPMQPAEWRPRLQQPIDVLYGHALNGFFGPDDTYMPPRGGNPKLSDAEVKSAVDYMTTLARHYIDQQTTDRRSK
jgi:cytochrome c5